MNAIQQQHFGWLCQLMPLASTKTLARCIRETSHYPSPLVLVTTHSKADARMWKQSRRLYAAPYFDLRFAIAKGDRSPALLEHECIEYPAQLAGNLFLIRKYLEETFFKTKRLLIISDDDAGSNFKNRGYQPKMPRAIIPDVDSIGKCGAQRISVTPEQLRLLWCIAFYFGKKQRCAYVGLNGSEQQLTALTGFETSGSCPNRSFGTYGLQPLRLNVAITGASGIIRLMRGRVPLRLRRVKQEWATASLAAIAAGFGTCMLMPVQATFAVKPPRDAEADILLLMKEYPLLVKPSNSAGGRDKEEKTGCIIHLQCTKELII